MITFVASNYLQKRMYFIIRNRSKILCEIKSDIGAYDIYFLNSRNIYYYILRKKRKNFHCISYFSMSVERSILWEKEILNNKRIRNFPFFCSSFIIRYKKILSHQKKLFSLYVYLNLE